MAGKRHDDDEEEGDALEVLEEEEEDEDEDEDDADAPDPRPAPGDTTLNYMDTELVVALAKKKGTTFVKARDAVLKAMIDVIPNATGSAEDKGALTAVVSGKRLRGDKLDAWIDAIVESAASRL